MRAKPSSTASGMYSRSGPLTESPAAPTALLSPNSTIAPECARSPLEQVAQGEGLLHDARNLMNALGLYTDLLTMPGVLKPEHLHYAEELRLLGTLSGTLMERLTLALLAAARASSPGTAAASSYAPALPGLNSILADPDPDLAPGPATAPAPVTLREIVQRCSGLLGRVAGGRAIELSFGPASSAPIPASCEDVERVLVNLVRNAAAALDARSVPQANAAECPGRVRSIVREVARDRTSDPAAEAIRIGVGHIRNRSDDAEPGVLRRVRLTVEDSGCGMEPEQVERILRSPRAASRGSRGIGLRVVRELVAGASGELAISSALGVGTRVQIEWPVASQRAQAVNEGPSDSPADPPALTATAEPSRPRAALRTAPAGLADAPAAGTRLLRPPSSPRLNSELALQSLRSRAALHAGRTAC